MTIPTAKEKSWLDDITAYGEEYGSVVPGPYPLQRHHVAGRAYIHNKIHIGHWFILILPWELHDVHSNHPLNVTHYPRRFTEEYGNQRDIFLEQTTRMDKAGFDIPAPEIMWAISTTRF